MAKPFEALLLRGYAIGYTIFAPRLYYPCPCARQANVAKSRPLAQNSGSQVFMSEKLVSTRSPLTKFEAPGGVGGGWGNFKCKQIASQNGQGPGAAEKFGTQLEIKPMLPYLLLLILTSKT